ncbi:MAG: tetratricopeptide repeat protein [Gemmatimonadaceae bacterium]
MQFARVAGLALVVLTSTGCFASLAQLDEVNEAVNVTRAEAAASDSVRATQLVQILGTLRALNDSIAALNLRLTRLRAETQAETRSMRQEVNQMLEVTGQSERRMRELREQMDRRAAAAAANAAATGDTTGSASPPASAEPGPSELIQLGRDQLLRGANSAARAVFADFLTRYPESDLAVEAHFYIAESHAAEGSTAAADSAYSIVVTRFPSSTRAPTAVYKRGVMAQTAGRRTAARRLFNELISEYPSSDEAELARERLRVMN